MECDLGDLVIHYETYGSGRPLVMLPGRPSDHSIMERFMEPLFQQREGWLRLYPDLPGTGLTPGVERLTTHDQMLDVVLAFIDTLLPGQRFVLAGYSYGGYMARGVVSHRAASIDGVLLCTPQVKVHASLPPKTTIVKNPQLLAELDPGFAPLFEDLVVVQSSAMAAVLSEVLDGPEPDYALNGRLGAASPASFEVEPHAPLFVAPTLILTARQDNICGYRDAWELLEMYPGATFAVLDRAGHFAGFEQAELCRVLMSEWLDRVEEYTSH